MTEAAPKSLDDLLPSSAIDAEAAVISATILDPSALPKIVDFLQPEHFFSEAHRRLFEACRALFYRKDPIDPVTVAEWLRERDRLPQVGGLPGIGQLLDAAPVVANVRSYAIAVHDCWRRRQVMLVSRDVLFESRQGFSASANVQPWCESVVERVARIAMANPVRPVEGNEQILERIVAGAFAMQVEKGEGQPVEMSGFLTGIYGLDRLLRGVRPGAKTTIVADTGVGKTAIAIQIGVNVAKQGVGVKMFSKEMRRGEVVERMLAHESRVSINRIKPPVDPATGARPILLTPRERQAVLQAAAVLKSLPFLIDDTPRLTIEELSAATRSAKDEMLFRFRVPLGLVIDDNINRSEASRSVQNRERVDQLSHHTKQYKNLLREEEVAGVELAQLIAQNPNRPRVKPKRSDGIGECKYIGKEADDIVYLWEETPATPNDPRAEITLIVAKSRAGPLGEVRTEYRGDLFTFRDLNAPTSTSRQYVDPNPEPASRPPVEVALPEPPPGRFDDEDSNPLTEGLL